MDPRERLRAALSGDPAATRALVAMLAPVVHARVARVLVRRRGGSGRSIQQEVEDLTQEVFAVLFSDGGRVLRAWDERRGLSLESFCGLIAEREAASILRSGRRSPWKESATEFDELERQLEHVEGMEMRLASREQLGLLVERLRETLSPRGLELFQLLIVEEQSVETVCSATGMSADATYAWKSRLGKLARKLLADLIKSEPLVRIGESLSESAPPRRTPKEEEKDNHG